MSEKARVELCKKEINMPDRNRELIAELLNTLSATLKSEIPNNIAHL